MKLLDKDGLTYYTGKIKNELTDYVKFTDYATASKGGVFKTSGAYGTFVNTSNGILLGTIKTYADYGSAGNELFISKGTLENVITGKGLVSNTDYATSSTGGVIKIDSAYFGADLTNGKLYCIPLTYSAYQSKGDSYFISKGTLENVLAERIGTIDTILETLTVGSGV